MEQAGRKLVVEPILSTTVCGRILQRAGYIEAVASIIACERSYAFAHQEGPDPFAAPRTAATAEGGGYRLNGIKSVVRHADVVDAFVVSASGSDGAGCFLVDKAASGMSLEAFRLIDRSEEHTSEHQSIIRNS